MSDQEPDRQDSGAIGEPLRNARQAAGFTLEEVAAQLNLRVAQVAALENEAFTSLGALVYQRGYLTAYARLLKLDPEPLLRALEDANAEVTGPGRHGRLRKHLGQPDKLDHLAGPQRRLVWGALAIVALVILALLFVSVRQVTRGKIPGSQVTASTPQTAPTTAKAARPPLTVPEPTPPAGSAGRGPGLPKPITAPAAAAVAHANTAAAAGQPAVSARQPSTEPSPPAIAEPAITPAGEQQSITAGQAGAPGLATLALALRGDCWIDIRDATGRKLVYALRTAGSRFSVTGVAPFSVFLGNAQAVDLRLNDSPVSLPPGQRTVRLLLDPDQPPPQ